MSASRTCERSGGDGEGHLPTNHPEFRLLELPRHERVLGSGTLIDLVKKLVRVRRSKNETSHRVIRLFKTRPGTASSGTVRT